ncbi:hypothetical protein BZG01_12410 [Labilibaculum manganireducens]|uniref:Uncharacterized protein n=1 Tax=Labilibaculum manganireducens TaxID=1940525 RepID=A0A2N3I754_9BACT|nr:hypothetical protein BZG01_12410 [Labilibaculum manganireducens]
MQTFLLNNKEDKTVFFIISLLESSIYLPKLVPDKQIKISNLAMSRFLQNNKMSLCMCTTCCMCMESIVMQKGTA